MTPTNDCYPKEEIKENTEIIQKSNTIEKFNNVEPMRNILLFSSSNNVSSNNFIGTCNSSPNFFQNSVLIQYHSIICRLGFSLRKPRLNVSYKATLYINNNPTALSVIINNGSIIINGISIGKININALDLVSIYFESTDTSILEDGICASLAIMIN